MTVVVRASILAHLVDLVWVALAAMGSFGCSNSAERGRDHPSQDTSRIPYAVLPETLPNVQRLARGDSDSVIPLRFKPAPGESAAVVRGVHVAMQRPNGPVMRGEIRGQVFRLDPTPGKRYILFADQPRFSAPDGEHWGRSFYVLDLTGGGVALSPPLDMKDAEYITFEGIRDVDGDGSVDLVYCKGYEGEEELPRHLAATYRGAQWVPLSESLVAQGDCKGTVY